MNQKGVKTKTKVCIIFSIHSPMLACINFILDMNSCNYIYSCEYYQFPIYRKYILEFEINL